jgi:NDP-sugar pyrophosphorylase family protein
MKAVMLAGNFDWGECPLLLASARPLVPVANRPLISYGLAALRGAGVTEVAICANGDGSRVRQVFGGGSDLGLRLRYVEDTMPRGPAGCVKDAAEFIGEEDVIVIEGAIIPDFDLGYLLAAHRESGAALTIGVDNAIPPERWHEGISPHILGVYVFSACALDYIPEGGFHDIKEGLVGRLHKAGALVQAVGLDGMAPRVTGPESYLAINRWMLERLVSGRIDLPGYHQNGQCFVHKTADVASTVRLAGPVLVGPHTIVRDHAVLVGPVSFGSSCDVGEGAAVCFSALWDRVKIGRQSEIHESILAHGVTIPPESEVFSTVHLPGTHGAVSLERAGRFRQRLAATARLFL